MPHPGLDKGSEIRDHGGKMGWKRSFVTFFGGGGRKSKVGKAPFVSHKSLSFFSRVFVHNTFLWAVVSHQLEIAKDDPFAWLMGKLSFASARQFSCPLMCNF